MEFQYLSKHSKRLDKTKITNTQCFQFITIPYPHQCPIDFVILYIAIVMYICTYIALYTAIKDVTHFIFLPDFRFPEEICFLLKE